jgi:hypothetical protein
MEKFLKAVLLFTRHAEYESLTAKDAKQKLNEMARGLSHNFKKMFEGMAQLVPSEIQRLEQANWGGFNGAALIGVLGQGYMETRYPVPTAAAEKFPIGDSGFLHDPWGSSGTTGFIYAVCNMCYAFLVVQVDFSKMKSDFEQRFQHKAESLQRFSNVFWEPRCLNK